MLYFSIFYIFVATARGIAFVWPNSFLRVATSVLKSRTIFSRVSGGSTWAAFCFSLKSSRSLTAFS